MIRRIDDNKVKTAEINYSKNIEEKDKKRIQELNNSLKKKNNIKNKISLYLNILLLIITTALLTVSIVLKLDVKITIIFLVFFFLIFLKMIFEIKNNKKIDFNKIKNEIEVLEENLRLQKIEIREKVNSLNTELEESNKLIINEFNESIDIKYIENCIIKNYDELQNEYDIIEKNINSLIVKINSLEYEINKNNETFEVLTKIEEELEKLYSEKEELEKLNNSYNIAKKCMENAYTKFKQNISPDFTNNLCKIISKISNNKYTNVKLNDNDGLEVQVENGFYIPVDRLSIGTIDQMYLSLRLSAIKEISDEKLPLILDETFAFFDDERLYNIIKYLTEEFSENQIIILTCTNREIECLNSLNIEYNLINLEK